MGLQEVRYEAMGWIELTQGRDGWWGLVNAVMNFGSIKCGEFLD